MSTNNITAKTEKGAYTYTDFAHDAIALASGGCIFNTEKFICKANSLLESQAKKAEYNSTHKKPSQSKLSPETQKLIDDLRGLITTTPQTWFELAEKLGYEVTALKVSNAATRIEGVATQKVIRKTTVGGLTGERSYTAYYKA